MSSFNTPQGDMSLFAGTDESAWGGFFGTFLQGPHDSFVPVGSVFCRPTNATLGSSLSLLKVKDPGVKTEFTKDFSHDNVGSKLKHKQITEFIRDITRGLSDWTVAKEYDDHSPDLMPDNAFVKPTKDIMGYAKSKVKVEYNVWDGSGGRTARDYDRVVLVIYHKDGNDHWHISEPKGGENGADSNGNVIAAKVKEIEGNSKDLGDNPLILNAVVNFDPNPEKGTSGYDPEKDIVDIAFINIALEPEKMTVPLDPTKAHFRTPKLVE
jgi:hypothetical protein